MHEGHRHLDHLLTKLKEHIDTMGQITDDANAVLAAAEAFVAADQAKDVQITGLQGQVTDLQGQLTQAQADLATAQAQIAEVPAAAATVEQATALLGGTPAAVPAPPAAVTPELFTFSGDPTTVDAAAWPKAGVVTDTGQTLYTWAGPPPAPVDAQWVLYTGTTQPAA